MSAAADRPGPLVAIAYLTAVGALLPNILPVVFGAAALDLGLDERELGNLAFFLLGSLMLVTATTPVWVRRVDWRRACAIGLAATALAYTLAGLASGYALIALSLVLVGGFTGLFYGPAMAAVAEARSPDRAFGVVIAVQILLASAAIAAIPALITPRWGFAGAMIVIGLIVLAAAVLLPAMPKGGEGGGKGSGTAGQHAHARSGHHRLGTEAAGGLRAGLVCLAGIGIYYAGLSAVWAFTERIGHRDGLDPAFVGVILALSILFSAVGSGAAAVIGDRFGHRLPVGAAALLLLAGIAIYLPGVTAESFTVATIVFGVGWTLGIAYALGIMASVDTSKRLIAVAPGAVAFGMAAGPGIMGRVIVEAGYDAFLVGSGAMIVAGFALILAATRFKAPAPAGLAQTGSYR